MSSPDPQRGAPRRAALHRALLYRDEDEFLHGATAFAAEGVEAGERVLVVVPPRWLDPLRQELGPLAERVQLADATAWYERLGPMFTRFLRYLDRHARPGAGRVRILAEQPLGERPPLQARAYQRYEAVSNVAFGPYDTYVLCPYDVAGLPPELIEGARRSHPEVIERGRLRRSRSFTDPAAFIEENERRLPLLPPAGPAMELTTAEELSGARRFLEDEARRAGVEPEGVADLVLAAHEVAVNALEHGGGRVEIHAWQEVDGFRCQLADTGGGLREPFAGYLPPAPGARSGRGLWLAHQLCDIVEVSGRPEGTVVRLHAAL
jgi:anti-sigma regulatory factor (Ser/Thr protein kinase)